MVELPRPSPIGGATVHRETAAKSCFSQTQEPEASEVELARSSADYDATSKEQGLNDFF